MGYRIIQRRGGWIGCESIKGSETTFTILPLVNGATNIEILGLLPSGTDKDELASSWRGEASLRGSLSVRFSCLGPVVGSPHGNHQQDYQAASNSSPRWQEAVPRTREDRPDYPKGVGETCRR